MSTKMKVKPLGNRVLVKRSKAETSRGGILLPDSAQEKPKQGIVLAVGPGKLNDSGHMETMHIAEGDHVLFSSYAGTEVKEIDEAGEDEYLILSQEDILGILAS